MKIGDYEIEAEIGVGGMAKVYRAKHAFLETMHAIKVLDPEYRANAEARRRFLDEAKIQAKHLRHDNIIKVVNIVATEEHAALVMELVDGGSLESLVHDLKGKPDEIKRIMVSVLEAVGHAHAAGIIHRDLKPANVLLAREHGVLVPKVTDFGIAKVIDVGDKKEPLKARTHFAARMGTLPYMSPEQIRHAKDVTARSDIWSLGAMLYELATGELPFPGEAEFDVMENIVNGRYVPPATKNPGIDRQIAAVIEKALSTDPAQRYASCAEMAAALRGAGVVAVKPPPSPSPPPPAAEPPHTAPPPPPPLSEAAPARSKVPLVAGLCVVGALGLGGAALYLARRSDSVAPAGGAAAGSGSAALDSPTAVAALRRAAARIDAGDPWAGTGSSHWDVARTDFPVGFETPPAAARATPSGVRYLPLTGAGSTRTPKLGDHVRINLRMWRASDHALVESNAGRDPIEVEITSDNVTSEVLMAMTEHSSARSWLSMPGEPTMVADFEIVSIEGWDADDRTFPAGADAPPSSATRIDKTAYVMLVDRMITPRSPRDDDRARINYKVWRISDHVLVDSNAGSPPLEYTVTSGLAGRSAVLQRMTPGDIVRLWTEIELTDGTNSGVQPVVIDMQLVSFASSRCKGSFKSDEGLAITLTGDRSGPCGNYVFIDTSTEARPMCSGRLSCDGARSKLACRYEGMSVRIDGEITWECEDDVLTANLTIGRTTTAWKLPAVPD